jgi:hypothetical protein
VKPASPDSFSIFDKLDEEQIRNADKAVKQKMVYRYKNKDELTYSGIKFIILEMSRHGEVVEIESSETVLDKDVEDDQTKWYWRSQVKLRNAKTGYPSLGLAECTYLDENGNYNPFARQTSHSKSERNAQRKQIPEQRIIELLKMVKDEDIHVVEEPTTTQQIEYCDCESPMYNKFKTKCVKCNNAVNQYNLKTSEQRVEANQDD